jgi:hypothetical protein
VRVCARRHTYEQTIEEVTRIGGNVSRVDKVAFDDLLEGQIVTGPVKRRIARQHLEQDTAERPEIRTATGRRRVETMSSMIKKFEDEHTPTHTPSYIYTCTPSHIHTETDANTKLTSDRSICE